MIWLSMQGKIHKSNPFKNYMMIEARYRIIQIPIVFKKSIQNSEGPHTGNKAWINLERKKYYEQIKVMILIKSKILMKKR